MKFMLLAVIRFYRSFLSPMKPPTCRFVPTCSEYALEAIEKYGAVVGLVMAVRRVLRCHPFGDSGYDPVR